MSTTETMESLWSPSRVLMKSFDKATVFLNMTRDCLNLPLVDHHGIHHLKKWITSAYVPSDDWFPSPFLNNRRFFKA